MSSSDAYEDEMGRFLRLSDEELSRLLAGEAGARDEAFDDVAALLGEVRETFAVSAPDEKARELHLAAISETAQLTADKGNPVVRPVSKAHGPVARQVSGLPKWRRVMDWTKGFALKAFAGTIAASTSMVGLAYAGVDLPGQAAERAIEAVSGLELPNQGSDEEITAEETTLEDDGTTEAEENEPKGSRATGDEKSAAGRAKAAEKSGGRSEARGSDASAEGRATASEASEGASDAGADNAGADNAGSEEAAGSATGDEASSGGRATGSSKAQEAAGQNGGAATDHVEDSTNVEDTGPALDGAAAAEDAQSKNPTENGRP